MKEQPIAVSSSYAAHSLIGVYRRKGEDADLIIKNCLEENPQLASEIEFTTYKGVASSYNTECIWQLAKLLGFSANVALVRARIPPQLITSTDYERQANALMYHSPIIKQSPIYFSIGQTPKAALRGVTNEEIVEINNSCTSCMTKRLTLFAMSELTDELIMMAALMNNATIGLVPGIRTLRHDELSQTVAIPKEEIELRSTRWLGNAYSGVQKL